MNNTFSERPTLDELLSTLPAFRPVAYYDKHLDVIRTQIEDCSIREERYDRIITIFHKNHMEDANGVNDIVGFSIKGARSLLQEAGLVKPADKLIVVVMADFLDLLVKLYPTKATRAILEFYRTSGAPNKVDVDLAAALPA